MFSQWKDAGHAEKQETICKGNWKALVPAQENKGKAWGLKSGKVLDYNDTFTLH